MEEHNKSIAFTHSITIEKANIMYNDYLVAVGHVRVPGGDDVDSPVGIVA